MKKVSVNIIYQIRKRKVMGDLLKHITELKEDGRITDKGKGSIILANYFDCLDSGCETSRPLPITDNSPASRNRSFRNPKNKP
jgi:hypothetical protein